MTTQPGFKPAWWLPGAHLQTLYPALVRERRPPPLLRERFELPDGDFLDLDWSPAQNGPLVVILHGLEGSVRSHYAAGLMHALHSCRRQSVLMHFRGCSGEPNRLPKSYHSGYTEDLHTLLAALARRHPGRSLYLVGVSLGGNVVLKWLGEHPSQSFVERAVAVSVPFELNKAALRMERGLSRLYQYHLLRKLRRAARQKTEWPGFPVRRDALRSLTTFRRFDDAVTAPLHGFRDVDDYYARASSRQYLHAIRTPTLVLHAADDPFMTPDAIPGAGELGGGVTLELSAHGGHVGFVAGRWPWAPVYWLDQRVCEAFADTPASAD